MNDVCKSKYLDTMIILLFIRRLSFSSLKKLSLDQKKKYCLDLIYM